MTQFSGLSNVPLFSVTADKLITSFLRIPQANTSSVIENIVVVMDGSGSIRSSEFEKGKRALKNMMGIANFTASDARYAAVTFSDSAMINFLFLPHAIAASEITKIPRPGGLTNTYIGLAVAKKLFESLSSGTSSRQCNVALDCQEQTKGLNENLHVTQLQDPICPHYLIYSLTELPISSSEKPDSFLLRPSSPL